MFVIGVAQENCNCIPRWLFMLYIKLSSCIVYIVEMCGICRKSVGPILKCACIH